MKRLLFLMLIPCLMVGQGIQRHPFYNPAVVAAAPITMTFVRDSVRANDRDATSDGTDENLSSGGGSNIYASTYNPGAVEEMIGLQFQLAIPQGSVIDSAFISTTGFENYGTWSTTADSVDIYVYEVDNAPAFNASHTHALTGHSTVSTAKVRTTMDASLGTFWTSPNLKDLVKLVITDRAGWASGNYIGFIIRVGVSSVDEGVGIRDYNYYGGGLGGDASHPARMRVAYH
jgi:hypothetical protein